VSGRQGIRFSCARDGNWNFDTVEEREYGVHNMPAFAIAVLGQEDFRVPEKAALSRIQNVNLGSRKARDRTQEDIPGPPHRTEYQYQGTALIASGAPA